MRYDGLTDEWIKQQLREGAITTGDLCSAYERFILGHKLPDYERTLLKRKCCHMLHSLEKYKEVERCGCCMVLASRYQTWRVCE